MAQPNQTRTLSDLGQLASLAERPEAEEAPQPKLDQFGRAYATGKRKNAIARVWIKRGSGRITVNDTESHE